MTDIFLPMRLREAARLLRGEVSGEDVGFTEVGTDSRRLPEGALFVASPPRGSEGRAPRWSVGR